jgi:uncharacterized protein YifN (PemK superfamily)
MSSSNKRDLKKLQTEASEKSIHLGSIEQELKQLHSELHSREQKAKQYFDHYQSQVNDLRTQVDTLKLDRADRQLSQQMLTEQYRVTLDRVNQERRELHALVRDE